MTTGLWGQAAVAPPKAPAPKALPPKAPASQPAAVKPAVAKPAAAKPAPAKTTAAKPEAPKPVPPPPAAPPPPPVRLADPASAKAAFEKSERHALLVAPASTGDGLAAPDGADFMINLLADELKRHGYTVRKLDPAKATAAAVRTALADKKAELESHPGATFLLAFSGQGFQAADGQNYLITAGVEAGQVERQALPVAELQKLIVETGAARKLVLLDAARDGKTMGPVASVDGVAQIIASPPGKNSFDQDFYVAAMEALRSGAGPDGLVTAVDLASFVAKAVMKAAAEKDRSQVPYALGLAPDFLVATAGPAVKEPTAPPSQSPPPTTESDDDYPLEGKRRGVVERFRALMENDTLRLIRKGAKDPVVLALIKSAKLRDGQLRFEGLDGDRLLHMVVTREGQRIVAIQGRNGEKCGKDFCTEPKDAPLLPGEEDNVFRTLQQYAGLSKRIAGIGSRVPVMKDRFRGQLDLVKRQSGLAEEIFKGFDQLMNHRWEEFRWTAASVARRIQAQD